MRPSFEDIYISAALRMSQRSTCARLRVGCVITSEDSRYVFGIGYNGNATGLPNECDSTEVGNCGCLHAEENAVINCRSSRAERKVVYCTHLPCKLCAKRLINLGGVMRVVYLNDYRIRDSLALFEKVKIETRQYSIPIEP